MIDCKFTLYLNWFTDPSGRQSDAETQTELQSKIIDYLQLSEFLDEHQIIICDNIEELTANLLDLTHKLKHETQPQQQQQVQQEEN